MLRAFFRNFSVVGAAVIVAALAAYPFKRGVETLTGHGAVSAAAVREVVGRGGSVLAVLGGYRALAADFVWIKSYVSWERKNTAKCIAQMSLACALDPSMTSFWTQGASIIAFDTPHWIFAELPERLRSPEKMEALRKRQAKIALAFLADAIAAMPDNYFLLIQKGQIEIAAQQFSDAERTFERASEIGGTFYARRIYASLLKRNGKPDQAKAVVEKMISECEPDNPVLPILQKF